VSRWSFTKNRYRIHGQQNIKFCLYLCFKETISEHRETFSPDCTRDLIDSFLEEMELRKKETDSNFNGKMNKIYLPDIRRVLHLTAKFDAIYIFTGFDYKYSFLQNYLLLLRLLPACFVPQYNPLFITVLFLS